MSPRHWFAVAIVATSQQLAPAQEPQPLPSGRMSPEEIKSEPSLAPTGLPGEDIRLEPETPSREPVAAPYKLRLQPPTMVTPILPPLGLGTGSANRLSAAPSVYVKSFRFRGNHVYS